MSGLRAAQPGLAWAAPPSEQRVALRSYAEGMRFSSYPAFGPAGTGSGPALPGAARWPSPGAAAPWQDAFSA